MLTIASVTVVHDDQFHFGQFPNSTSFTFLDTVATVFGCAKGLQMSQITLSIVFVMTAITAGS